jgi:hypothetical protein
MKALGRFLSRFVDIRSLERVGSEEGSREVAARHVQEDRGNTRPRDRELPSTV